MWKFAGIEQIILLLNAEINKTEESIVLLAKTSRKVINGFERSQELDSVDKTICFKVDTEPEVKIISNSV